MKICSQCNKSKSLDMFSAASAKKDGKQPYCKECAKKYFKSWQEKSPETRKRHGDWKAQRREENRIKYLNFINDKNCIDCGTKDWRVLEFDHVSGDKVAGVMTMVSRGSKWSDILAEIEKCEIRCRNCHYLKSAERGGWWTHVSVGEWLPT